MPSFAERLSNLAKNPKAQEYIEKAKVQAQKPENRQKIEKLAKRFTKGGGSSGR